MVKINAIFCSFIAVTCRPQDPTYRFHDGFNPLFLGSFPLYYGLIGRIFTFCYFNTYAAAISNTDSAISLDGNRRARQLD